MLITKIFVFTMFLYVVQLYSKPPQSFIKTSYASRSKKSHQKTPSFILSNETLNYDVSYLGLVGGTIHLSTETQKTNNKVAFSLKAKSFPWVEFLYSLELNLFSLSHKHTMENILLEENYLENKRSYYQKMVFLTNEKKMHFYTNQQQTKPIIKDYFYNALNILSILYYIRTLDLETGATFHTEAYHRGKHLPMAIEVLGIKTIKTHFGPIKCFVVSPTLQVRGFFLNTDHLKVYLSHDEHRIPVLLKGNLPFGVFRATLSKGLPEK